MTASGLSLLEAARIRFPGSSDIDCVERVAAEIIEELDERPPVSLHVVASHRDIGKILIQPLPFAGSLTPEPTGLVMRLNELDIPPRRRFSGFHEIGHTFQPGYTTTSSFRCTIPTSATRATGPEGLADAAAAELLLPRRFFHADLRAVPPGWDGVVELADAYDASLYATALRALRLSESMLLVVLEPGLTKAETRSPYAVPKLRVKSSMSNGPFPYIPPNKSAQESGLTRALAGEPVEDVTTLRDLGLDDDRPLHISARCLPYLDDQGDQHDRVMALYWPAA